MTLLSLLSSMSSMVTSIGPAFQGIGKIASEIFKKIGDWWNKHVSEPLSGFMDSLSAMWDDFSSSMSEIWDYVGGLVSDFFSIFTDFSLPDIFTSEYWSEVFDIEIPWDAIFDFLIPDWLTTLASWLTFETPDWDSLFDFTLPDWLTTLASWLSFDIPDWDDIFDFDISSWFDFDIDSWFDFSWSDILPDWSWDDIIPDSISDFFSLENLSTLWGGITAMFQGVIDPIKGAINDYLISTINDILSWNPPGPGGTVGNILGIQNIPALAKGGIVNSATLAMIGEDGPEAVIPLSQRNNPSGIGMGGSTFNITVNAGGITDRSDKRQLAREIGNLIQSEMARTLGGSTMRGRY